MKKLKRFFDYSDVIPLMQTGLTRKEVALKLSIPYDYVASHVREYEKRTGESFDRIQPRPSKLYRFDK